MKLRNKKTGEIVDIIAYKTRKQPLIESIYYQGQFKTLAELNEEWEDVPEEPKGCWIINILGIVEYTHFRNKDEAEMLTEIGNRFETKEEAEKAAEKLKAWKRLKDNGFKFEGWKRDEKYWGDFTITAADQTSCDDKDLDLLFGGEK